MTNSQSTMQKGQLGQSWNEQQLKLLAVGQSSDVQWCNANDNKPLLNGTLHSHSLNGDWHWHYARVIAAEDTEVNFEIPPGMTFGLVFEGHLNLEIAGKLFLLKPDAPLAFCLFNATNVPLKRQFKAGGLVHKFTLHISRGWLKAMELKPFVIQDGHKFVTFSASDEVVTVANAILALPEFENLQYQLQQIANVNRLLIAAGKELDENGNHCGRPLEASAAATLEQRLVGRVREIIQRENILLEDIQIEDLAKSLGTSVSGIQRLAKKCFGQSLQKHIRQAKLANALSAIKERRLSIGEAAFLAGYKQSSNFSFAFRKAYGLSPGEILKAS